MNTSAFSLEDEQLRAMLEQEEEIYFCPDYLNVGESSDPIFANEDNGSDVLFPDADKGELWRRKICEWSYKVVDHFRLDREVVSIGLNFLDRYLATQRNGESLPLSTINDAPVDFNSKKAGRINSTLFQLYAITTLYVAVKIHAENIDGQVLSRAQRLSIHSFVELTRGQFTVCDLQRTEMEILKSLEWRINPPTPMKFIYLFLRFIPNYLRSDVGGSTTVTETTNTHNIDERVIHVLYELSRYLTELSVCVYSLSVTNSKAVIAFASILVSVRIIDPEVLPESFRVSFLRRMEHVTSLRPDSTNVKKVIKQMQEICPDFSVCGCRDFLHDLEDHPLAIAREAGFLVSSSSAKKKCKQVDALAQSPKCVSTYGTETSSRPR